MFRIQFHTKNSTGAYVYLPQEWSQGAQHFDIVEILPCTEMANYIQFRAQCCQKYTSHPKKLQIKIVWNWISHKKVRKHICLSFGKVELGGAKDWYGWNIILHWNSKIHSFRDQRCQKYASHQKKVQIKVVWNSIPYKKVHERICLFSPPLPE